LEHFQTYEELPRGKRLVKTGQQVSEKAIGGTIIQAYNPTRKNWGNIMLLSVLLIVECECSLSSARQLAQIGLYALFAKDYALILQDRNIEIARGGI
jgi:hypothetical protein